MIRAEIRRASLNLWPTISVKQKAWQEIMNSSGKKIFKTSRTILLKTAVLIAFPLLYPALSAAGQFKLAIVS